MPNLCHCAILLGHLPCLQGLLRNDGSSRGCNSLLMAINLCHRAVPAIKVLVASIRLHAGLLPAERLSVLFGWDEFHAPQAEPATMAPGLARFKAAGGTRSSVRPKIISYSHKHMKKPRRILWAMTLKSTGRLGLVSLTGWLTTMVPSVQRHSAMHPSGTQRG
ncbi:uncharacterized protein B0T15DRAFT_66439 [Chaetomium strumarium]|uniref:Uncharacterized protein n=1 Tax=Chaetomium strumarium TaxID=1170767 RepID=A0AAJ0M6T5_9PEZI|nr:hypothetical protein B0T15DRAFT_66439 [Chaetomium strumarium]